MHMCTGVNEEGGDGEAVCLVCVVYYKWRKRELYAKLMHESVR
jgi:hypothetical protein